MPLDHSLIGIPSEPHERSWTSTDALLYAIAVGAGLGDPRRELEFTTENSAGIEQKVLPTRLDDGGALFQTARQDGTVVIDRGRMRVRDRATPRPGPDRA